MADDFDPYYQWLGISPKHQPPNHYRLLALDEFESNLDVIENAADQRMAHVRMFQSGPQGAVSQRLLNEITAAKLCLLNVTRKAEYDRKLRAEKDAAEPRRLRPLPRLEPTPAAAEGYRIASDVAAVPEATPVRRGLSAHQIALIAGALAGLLIAAVLVGAFIASRRTGSGGQYNALNHNPGDVPAAVDSNTFPTTGKSSTETTTGKTVVPSPSDQSAESVFLDDLQEQEFKVGHGTLGKRGYSGHPTLPEAIFQGVKVPHTLVTVPASRDTAHVAYELNGAFKSLRATAGLLEVAGETHAGSDLAFKVYGDGKLLWQSKPIGRLGTGQSVTVDIQGVKTLKLEVQCPGPYDFAWAAWMNPIVSKLPLGGPSPTPARPNPAITSLANPEVRFTVPAEHYAVLRGGDVEAVIADNEAVDSNTLPRHRSGNCGLASLKHKGRPVSLFGPGTGLSLTCLNDGTTLVHEIYQEPRRTPLELRVISERIVELHQKPTPHWALESAMRYELLDDGVIEMTFECIPRKRTFSNGYIGCYFTSYIDRPESMDVHFRGHPRGGRAEPQWIRGVAPAVDQQVTHAAATDQRALPRGPDFPPLSWAVDPSGFAYDEPWYYGVSHGMAYVQMFRADDQVRFTHSPLSGAGSPEWSFAWFIPNYEVNKLYRLVMRAMYVPLEMLHVGLVEPHVRQLNAGAVSSPAPSTKTAYLDDLPEVESKVYGVIGKHGRGFDVNNPRGITFEGRAYSHALHTHAALADGLGYVVYHLDAQFVSFRALAALTDLPPGYSPRSAATLKVVADGKLLWDSGLMYRAGAGQLCSLDIRGVKTLRLEVHSAGHPEHQHAAWLNPLVSTALEPPAPPLPPPRASQWTADGGVQFKLSETPKGIFLELVPETSKHYSKIEITLTKNGELWSGTGDLYFKTTPDKRYEAKIEIASGDVFGSPTLRVRTICPIVNMRTKLVDSTSTWVRKEP